MASPEPTASAALPSIAVVIPVYRVTDYLEEAIASATHQDYARKEVIVVDDGSVDDTHGIITRDFPEVRCIRQSNGGASSARNRGVQEARGEWIAFLDADDAWHPDKLRAQLALMQRHPELKDDFSAPLPGAALSEGGKPIIAMPSTTTGIVECRGSPNLKWRGSVAGIRN